MFVIQELNCVQKHTHTHVLALVDLYVHVYGCALECMHYYSVLRKLWYIYMYYVNTIL